MARGEAGEEGLGVEGTLSLGMGALASGMCQHLAPSAGSQVLDCRPGCGGQADGRREGPGGFPGLARG